MKISYSWLSEYLPAPVPVDEAARLLTGCGLEVESTEPVESVRGGLRGLVVGFVSSCDKHPNADKLSITKVDTGGPGLLQIVCGAPNVAAGQKVIVALTGTTVYPVSGEPFEIKKSKIRGEVSEGMICAEDEIGLGASHAGIMILDENAVVGTPAAEYFGISNDYLLEIGLTPNRADAASHYGVARDLAAVLHAQDLLSDSSAEFSAAKFPALEALDEDLPAPDFEIVVENPEACLRYCGIVIKNLHTGPSPKWLQDRLQIIGLRPINNVVDITNYVQHELGQPLHAFDAAKIKGRKVVVKKTPAGTKFVTLDGTERKLDADDLMICDAEEPMCIGGVFGGLHSGVDENTTEIFLEAATFDPVHIRKTSKRHGLKTDASFRFERGTDPNMPVKALQRAAYLLRDIAGGNIVSSVFDHYPAPVEDFQVAFSFSHCERLIGKAIDRTIVKKIMQALGIEFASEGSDGVLLAIPPFKVDVKREADVIEEILRVYGYNNVEVPEHMMSTVSIAPKPDAEAVQHTISDMLASVGFAECWNNSLVKSSWYEGLPAFPAEEHVKLLNPLSSDLDMMRRTLLFGGLETIAYNQNRRQTDLRLFEFGKVYQQNPGGTSWKYTEEHRLILFITGKREPETWNKKPEATDFFDLKRVVQQVIARLGLSGLREESCSGDLLRDGLKLSAGKQEIVRYGRVPTALLKKAGIEGQTWYAEFSWSNALKALGKREPIRYAEVPKFPAVRRDLALVLPASVTFRDIEQLAFQSERKLLRHVNLFDVYEGESIGAGKKSYAISFILQDEEATLTDKQIDKVMEKLMKTYTEKLGAVIRS